MINKIVNIIGADFGDEGKGLMTDYKANELKRHYNPVVVRFNGGSQAGHTVVTPEGKRHVFGHIGSGYFAGVPTHLSQYFISNPIKFFEEYKLLDPTLNPKNIKLTIDPRSIVTTPWDMYINYALEKKRGVYKHGSCGYGINVTVDRSKQYELFTIYHLIHGITYDRLKTIKFSCEKLAEDYGINTGDEEFQKFFNDDNIIRKFQDDCKRFKEYFKILKDDNLNNCRYNALIFEGAQGLSLDESSDNFPHVTRSKTGTYNIRNIILTSGIKCPIETIYCTRWYRTKHGAGNPIDEFTPIEKNSLMIDKTNVPNEFQDSQRVALLNINDLINRINIDNYLDDDLSLAVTCLDQVDRTKGTPPFISYRNTYGYITSNKRGYFIQDIINNFSKLKILYTSHGETRDTIAKPYTED